MIYYTELSGLPAHPFPASSWAGIRSLRWVQLAAAGTAAGGSRRPPWGRPAEAGAGLPGPGLWGTGCIAELRREGWRRPRRAASGAEGAAAARAAWSEAGAASAAVTTASLVGGVAVAAAAAVGGDDGADWEYLRPPFDASAVAAVASATASGWGWCRGCRCGRCCRASWDSCSCWAVDRFAAERCHFHRTVSFIHSWRLEFQSRKAF